MVCPNCGKEIEEGKTCTCSDEVTNEMLVKQYREMVYDSRIKKEKQKPEYRKSIQLLIPVVAFLIAIAVIVLLN
jgi:uncharacterized membrane protein YvbJ